jgi:hypothetical protein
MRPWGGLLQLGLCICLARGDSVRASQKGGEYVVPEGTRITLRLNDYLSTKLNSEGDIFTGEVVAPIYQGDKLLIPRGSTVTGSISRIVRPGRFKGKAVMNVIFHSIRIPGRGQTAVAASLAGVQSAGNQGVKAEGTIQGEGSKGRDAEKVAAPGLSGAGIGGIVGGGKGAAMGGGIGAAVGLASVFATRGKDLEVRRGTTFDIVLDRPLVIAGEP